MTDIKAQFEAQGYYHAKGLFRPDDLAPLRSDFDRIVAQLQRSGDDVDATWDGGEAAKLALKDRGLEAPEDLLKGNVAVAWGDAEAAIGVAKAVTESPLKKAGKVGMRGGVLEGNVLGASDAAALADVPDRPTLQAKLLGVISGPARSLVTVLDANQSGLARVIQARIDAQGGEE